MRCECGCGGPVPVARHPSWQTRFIHGHNRRTHGHWAGGKTPTYRTWDNMIQRTSNPRATQFADYGGRGITVCTRWHDFAQFLADMGERPTGTSIDRIDVNGNYEPGNCRWATGSEQRRNRRAA